MNSNNPHSSLQRSKHLQNKPRKTYILIRAIIPATKEEIKLTLRIAFDDSIHDVPLVDARLSTFDILLAFEDLDGVIGIFYESGHFS
jgi:hypothetical protein